MTNIFFQENAVDSFCLIFSKKKNPYITPDRIIKKVDLIFKNTLMSMNEFLNRNKNNKNIIETDSIIVASINPFLFDIMM